MLQVLGQMFVREEIDSQKNLKICARTGRGFKGLAFNNGQFRQRDALFSRKVFGIFLR